MSTKALILTVVKTVLQIFPEVFGLLYFLSLLGTMNLGELHLNGPWWAAHLKTYCKNVTCAVHCKDASPDLDGRLRCWARGSHCLPGAATVSMCLVIWGAFMSRSEALSDFFLMALIGQTLAAEFLSALSGKVMRPFRGWSALWARLTAVWPATSPRFQESCAPSSLFWVSEWDIVSGQRRACDLSRGVLHWSIKMNGGKERECGDGRGQLAQVPIGWQRKVESSGVVYIRYGYSSFT